MNNNSRWLEEYASKPIEPMTDERALNVLRRAGALDANNKLKPEMVDVMAFIVSHPLERSEYGL